MKRYCQILCFCLLASCSAEQHRTTLLDTGKPALHAVQSERLNLLMNQLNDLMFERMLTEAELDTQRRMRTEEMAKVAATMLETIQEIPEALPALSLSPQEQQTFLKLNQRLKEQAGLLKQEAEKNYVDSIPSRLDSIVAICNECHRSFRQLPAE